MNTPGASWRQRQVQLEIATRGRGTYECTQRLREAVRDAAVHTGLCHVFIHHTSASLIITENADPTVRADLERVAARLAPDGDPIFAHDEEGPDDMPAHVRSVLTDVSLSVPITAGELGLGTWQGVFVWEHRAAPHRRRITVTVQGTA